MSPTLALAQRPAPPAQAQAQAGHDHAGHQHGTTGATTYVCPMHPEVTSDKPDQLCPKCNMKLVPKQP